MEMSLFKFLNLNYLNYVTNNINIFMINKKFFSAINKKYYSDFGIAFEIFNLLMCIGDINCIINIFIFKPIKMFIKTHVYTYHK